MVEALGIEPRSEE